MAGLPAPGLAQGDVVILPSSRITLHGRSNVNTFHCVSSTFDAVVRFDANGPAGGPEEYEAPAVHVVIALPVKTLDCGNGRMNQDLGRALDANRFPAIHYALVDYRLERGMEASDSIVVHTRGDLSVAGQTRRVAIVLRGTRANGVLTGSGGVDLLMTDFGVKPPTAFLGMIRTRNAIRVDFDVAASIGTTTVLVLRTPIAPPP